MTSTLLYGKDLAESPKSIALADISAVGIKSSKIVETLLINGEEFIQLTALNKAESQAFSELLQTMCNKLRVG